MDIVNRFLSFDKLMGPALVKIVYFLGVLGIALAVIGGVLAGLGTIPRDFGRGVGGIIVAPIAGVVFLCFWRFMCELYIVLFRAGEDVAAIRAQGGTKPPG